MLKNLCRIGILALLFAVPVASSEAQSSVRWPPPAPGVGIQGQWYYMGNPWQPCWIDMSPDGFCLTLTNEWGGMSRGRMVGGGRIAAQDWRVWGQYQGRVIRWSNGTYWTR